MTDEEVDNLENILRKAQDKIEEAGRLLCNTRGDCAPWMWGRCGLISDNIANLIGHCWKLRPEEGLDRERTAAVRDDEGKE